MAFLDSPYFKDRELVETKDARGKVRRRFVYRGDLFERRLTQKQRQTERYLDVLAALAGGGLAVLATVQDTSANRGGFFGVVSVLTLIPVLGVLVGALTAFFKKEDLTRIEYRERMLLLRTMPLIAAACLLLLAVGYGCYGAWLALGSALAAGALYVLMFVHERKVPYVIHPGTKEGPSAQ